MIKCSFLKNGFGALLLVCLSSQLKPELAFGYPTKSISIYVGAGAGGGYDATARLIAIYLGKFLDGNPRITVEDRPGAGGVSAANELYSVDPGDGSVVGTFSNAMLTAPLLGSGQAKFRPNQFHWIGSTSREPAACFIASATGVHSFDELRKSKLTIGSTGPGTTTYMYAAILQNLFNAPIKVVAGYRDGSEIALALERHEVDGVCETYSSIAVDHSDWLRTGFVVPIVAFSQKRIQGLATVPTILEFASSDQARETLDLAIAPTAAGRPYAMPPSTPSDIVKEMRVAFEKMATNEEFKAGAQHANMSVEFVPGAEIEQLVDSLYSLSADSLATAKRELGLQN